MADDHAAPHLVIPKATQVDADEYELFRQVRQLRRTLTGTKVVVVTLELSPKNIFLLESRIVDRVPLGS